MMQPSSGYKGQIFWKRAGSISWLTDTFFLPQVAEAKADGEASGAAGGPRALPQAGVRGAACAAHEGLDVHRQWKQTVQSHWTAGLPLLSRTNPARRPKPRYL